MKRAPIKIDERALERQKIKTLLAEDAAVQKLTQTPLEKLRGIERLLAALYRSSDLFPQENKVDPHSDN